MSDYSGAQLKKKGKRVCNACIDKKTKTTAAAVAATSAAAMVAALSRQQEVEFNHAVVLPSPTVASCVVCKRVGTKLCKCSKCDSSYCSLPCLRQHRNGKPTQCDAIRTLPPLDISGEDLICADEVLMRWPRIKRRLLDMRSSSNYLSIPASELARRSELLDDFDAAGLASLPSLPIFPPKPAHPWWLQGRSGKATADAMLECLRHLYCAVVRCNGVYRLHDLPVDQAELADDFCFHPVHTQAPASEDSSRLFHRLLRLGIYFFRYVHPTSLPEELRGYVDVTWDQIGEHMHWPPLCSYYGTLGPSHPAIAAALTFFLARICATGRLPLCIVPCDASNPRAYVVSLGYLQVPDQTGQPTLVPFVLEASQQPGPHEYSCGMVEHSRGQRVILYDSQGTLAQERGFVVRLVPHSSKPGTFGTTVDFVSGNTGDPRTSWHLGPILCKYDGVEYMAATLADPWCDDITREKLELELEARQQPGYFHPVDALHKLLKDEWPRELDSVLFVSWPRAGLESELNELHALDELHEQAAAGDEQAQLLLAHVEEQHAAPIAELISAQRSKLQQMLNDQQEQLRLHAEAVARHNITRDGGHRNSAGLAGIRSTGGSSSTSAVGLSQRNLTDSASGSGTSSVLGSSAATSAESPRPIASANASSWTVVQSELEPLIAASRVKYRVLARMTARFLRSQAAFIRGVSTAGSHSSVRLREGPPLLHVRPHAGGRSKDGTVPRRFQLGLFEQLSACVMRQFRAGVPTAAPPAASVSVTTIVQSSQARLLQ